MGCWGVGGGGVTCGQSGVVGWNPETFFLLNLHSQSVSISSNLQGLLMETKPGLQLHLNGLFLLFCMYLQIEKHRRKPKSFDNYTKLHKVYCNDPGCRYDIGVTFEYKKKVCFPVIKAEGKIKMSWPSHLEHSIY